MNLRTVVRTFGMSMLLLSLLGGAGCSGQVNSTRQQVEVGGRLRSWQVHLPAGYAPGKPLPLVIVFHGRLGTAAGMERLSGLDTVADRNNFIVVYPQGIDRSWAAHIGTPADKKGVDDVAFTTALLEQLEQEYPIDTSHIVLTGFSNGAHMVQLLGCRLAYRISAIVPVSGTLASSAAADCHPARPITVVEFHGTADPIDPYAGGHVAVFGSGNLQAAEQSIAGWAARDKCHDKPVEKSLPSNGDPFTVQERNFPGCTSGVSVRLYSITGAGHVWPGGRQYLPVFVIGHATKAIDASAIIGALATGHASTISAAPRAVRTSDSTESQSPRHPGYWTIQPVLKFSSERSIIGRLPYAIAPTSYSAGG
ncbi:MAG TPA: PHB depolymerase family esterase [Gammaproteobacteria bacterium]|nr:PHB depolymerase family esterase [Gammaproteobacteria bacterium]